MTTYKDGLIQCSCHRILNDLYYSRGEPRTAQTFLCCGPGDVTADLINVHAPSSGKKSLTDQQRIAFLTSLLQSNSKSMPGRQIGRARFLIGGDMNTKPLFLPHFLHIYRRNCSLHTHRSNSMNPYSLSMEIFFSEISKLRPSPPQQRITILSTNLTEYVGSWSRSRRQSNPGKMKRGNKSDRRKQKMDQRHNSVQLHLLGMLQSNPCK